MPSSTISYLWRDKDAPKGFRTGVSLHSHTNQSHETLDFLANFGNQFPVMRPLLSRLERRAEQMHGVRINYAASYWTPPMTPKLAFDLESRQIREAGPGADGFHHRSRQHQGADAAAHGAQRAPDSGFGGVERALWRNAVVPSGRPQPAQRTRDGVDGDARGLHRPSQRCAPHRDSCRALHHEPNVLVVFNHPMWDLYLIGKEKHQFLVNEFLQKNGAYLHALELNGLRNWDENRAVRRLAEKWNMLLISGGDRHGVEPNANINLTNATSFTEFVHEIRREKKSNVLFMPQYAEPWKHRILQSTIDAIRHYPEFPQGSRTWDERVYHPDANGVVRPLSELWPKGSAPRVMSAILAMVQMMGHGLVSGGLRLAWSESHQLRLALGEHDG